MGRIQDFQCTYDNAAGVGRFASEEFGILFPDAYLEHNEMVKLALAVKAHNGAHCCQLPFCHTLEAEALGGNIRLGDGMTGPRAAGYVCSSLEEVLELPALDLESEKAGRVRETLLACQELKKQGESVMFLVSGPMTILNGLLDSEVLFRALLRKSELVFQVFEKLSKDILVLIKAAEEAGADVISYADPAGGVKLVGPKVAERVAKNFTAGFLNKADMELEKETLVLLCPKTALALVGSGVGEWKNWMLLEPMEYVPAALYMKKQIRFAGQDCINHAGHRLEDCVFKELVINKMDGGEHQ